MRRYIGTNMASQNTKNNTKSNATNTPTRAVSMTSNMAMKPRTLVVIASQDTKTQMGMIPAVIKTSGRLIPSRPRL